MLLRKGKDNFIHFLKYNFKKLAFKNTNKFSFENRNINGLKLIIV